MSQSIQKKHICLLLAGVLVFAPQITGLISILRGILSNSNVELNVISVTGQLVTLFIILFLVKDKNWRYSVVSGIVATILMSAARFIFDKWVSASVVCAVASIASLGPAPFFLRRFWVTDEIQVYGTMRANSPWRIVATVLILLAAVIVMYVVGGLWPGK